MVEKVRNLHHLNGKWILKILFHWSREKKNEKLGENDRFFALRFVNFQRIFWSWCQWFTLLWWKNSSTLFFFYYDDEHASIKSKPVLSVFEIFSLRYDSFIGASAILGFKSFCCIEHVDFITFQMFAFFFSHIPSEVDSNAFLYLIPLQINGIQAWFDELFCFVPQNSDKF